MTDEIKGAWSPAEIYGEFKAEAVRPVMTSGRPLSAIVRGLGIRLSQLYLETKTRLIRPTALSY